MEDLINTVKINAKHSNEDVIAPFTEWQKRYGDRIALFGGVDMSFVCNAGENEIREYVSDLLKEATKFPGYAFGTGNSVPDYMPVENYITMIETARSFKNI
jgi:uroporphyrinogen decarboxylase